MRRIVLFAFQGVQVLDVTGPAAVFAAANDEAEQPAYALAIASAAGMMVESSAGVTLGSVPLASLPTSGVDTLLVPGGDARGVVAASRDEAAREWTKAACVGARRYGSVCSGAAILAEWGLLDGRRVATHWRGSRILQQRHPGIIVDERAIFIEDGPVWTSAGVTAGIDMSLAMVEQDLGAAVANRIARRLVLYARRPGNQSQFSELLDAQARGAEEYGPLIAWISDNLSEPLDVETLSARAAQSLRSFQRRFTAATGRTPAAFVEALRLERARTLLAGRGSRLHDVARASGFGSPERLARAFRRAFGISPTTYRALHGGEA